jgi:DNA processing protein
LIRQGAKLTASAEDILDEYAWAEKEKPGKRQPTLFEENEPEGLSDEEKTVYAILSKEESLSVDEIIYRLHGRGDASNVAFLLLQMQLKGLVEEDENRAYSRA